MAQALPPFQIPARQYASQDTTAQTNGLNVAKSHAVVPTVASQSQRVNRYQTSQDYESYADSDAQQQIQTANFSQHWPSQAQQQVSATRQQQQQAAQSFDTAFGGRSQQQAQLQSVPSSNRSSYGNVFGRSPVDKQQPSRQQQLQQVTQRMIPSPRSAVTLKSEPESSYGQMYQQQALNHTAAQQYTTQEPLSSSFGSSGHGQQASYGGVSAASGSNGYANYNMQSANGSAASQPSSQYSASLHNGYGVAGTMPYGQQQTAQAQQPVQQQQQQQQQYGSTTADLAQGGMYGTAAQRQQHHQLQQMQQQQETHQRAPSLDLRGYGAFGVPPLMQQSYGSYGGGGAFSGAHSFGQSPYAISRSVRPPPSGSERPFKCDQCPQSFQRSHDLKRHKRIHLAVKPFPCPSCDKSFSRKDALKRHILVKGLPGHGASVLNEYNQRQAHQLDR